MKIEDIKYIQDNKMYFERFLSILEENEQEEICFNNPNRQYYLLGRKSLLSDLKKHLLTDISKELEEKRNKEEFESLKLSGDINNPRFEELRGILAMDEFFE
jgi:hypothetical protein